MKKVNLKQFLAIGALLIFTASMTSCNRGYGCPQNFSIKSFVSQLADQAGDLVKQLP